MNKVSAIQMSSTNNLEDNLKIAKRLIKNAVNTGSKLIVLPEMFVMQGLTLMDKVAIKETYGSGKIQDFLAKEAKMHQIWIVGGTIPIACSDENKIRAACLLYNDQGEVVARYDKVHLFDVILHQNGEPKKILESSATQAGNDIVVANTPFGKLGLAVCYDLRFPEMFRTMFNRGVEIIVIPTAFTKTTGQAHWEILTRSRAIENFSYVIGACQTGIHPSGHETYGHSLIIDPWGNVLNQLEYDTGIISAEIDIHHLESIREKMPVMTHQRFYETK